MFEQMFKELFYYKKLNQIERERSREIDGVVLEASVFFKRDYELRNHQIVG